METIGDRWILLTKGWYDAEMCPCHSVIMYSANWRQRYIEPTSHTRQPQPPNGGRDKMAAIFRTTFSNAFSWMKIYEFPLRFQWNLILRVQLILSSIVLDNGLLPNRQQAIMLTNYGLGCRRIYASLRLNELTQNPTGCRSPDRLPTLPGYWHNFKYDNDTKCITNDKAINDNPWWQQYFEPVISYDCYKFRRNRSRRSPKV